MARRRSKSNDAAQQKAAVDEVIRLSSGADFGSRAQPFNQPASEASSFGVSNFPDGGINAAGAMNVPGSSGGNPIDPDAQNRILGAYRGRR
jgi:hypothetical protein